MFENSRRAFLRGAVSCTCCGVSIAIAGCVAEEGEGNGDDGEEEAGDGTDGTDDAEESDDGGDETDDGEDGNDEEGGDEDDDEEAGGDEDAAFEADMEFDPLDSETWYPQLVSTYLDHEFETGAIEELDLFEEREEPVYGQAPEAIPDDESEWLDPDVIDFSMVPTEDPAIYEETMEPLMANIKEETDRDVEYIGLDSYAAQVEAMRAERLHVAGFATGNTPFAVNLSGARPFAIQVGPDSFGYRLWVITHVENDDVTELDDLADQETVLHVDPSSNSGHLAPVAAFTDLGVEPGEDYEIEFSGSHENSANAIYQRDYDVGPICSTCLARAVEQNTIEADQLKSIWASAPFPTTAFCTRYNLHPDVQEGIQNAFLEYDYQETPIAEEFEGRGTWVEIDYATHWHDVLVNHEVNGVEYDDPEDA